MGANMQQPLALVVFLENVGHISGFKLPKWLMSVIDFVTEEYAKIVLRLYGAYRRYDKVIILEDAQATGPNLSKALIEASQQHVVDVLLLVHGHTTCLVGYKAREMVGRETFAPLLDAYQRDQSLLNLRMVYGVNCYGASLAPMWTALGAQAVNGAIGVNWMPEPSLTIFLRNWLSGAAYSTAVERSNLGATHFWRRLLKPKTDGSDHAAIASSRQIVFGQRDVRIHH